MATTTNSPKPTVTKFNQNGKCKIKCNSAPTIIPLTTAQIIGTAHKNLFSAGNLVIIKQAIAVARVPKIKSATPNEALKILEMKQPMINDQLYL